MEVLIRNDEKTTQAAKKQTIHMRERLNRLRNTAVDTMIVQATTLKQGNKATALGQLGSSIPRVNRKKSPELAASKVEID